MLANILTASVTAVAAIAVGHFGYLANSLHRQLKRGVQERQLTAYEGLWAVTGAAVTIRVKGPWAGGALTEDERHKLFQDMTRWYYDRSGGIYLCPHVRSLYLQAEENLLCPETEIKPEKALEEFAHTCDITERRVLLAIHQLSLLRWVMRFDPDIHTEPFNAKLMPKETQLLKDCDINPYKAPFKGYWTETQLDSDLEGSQPADEHFARPVS